MRVTTQHSEPQAVGAAAEAGDVIGSTVATGK